MLDDLQRMLGGLRATLNLREGEREQRTTAPSVSGSVCSSVYSTLASRWAAAPWESEIAAVDDDFFAVAVLTSLGGSVTGLAERGRCRATVTNGGPVACAADVYAYPRAAVFPSEVYHDFGTGFIQERFNLLETLSLAPTASATGQWILDGDFPLSAAGVSCGSQGHREIGGTLATVLRWAFTPPA
jgi:hypothetical protein